MDEKRANDKIIRVLVVSFVYYPVVGGLSQQAHLLNRSLQKQDITITVLTMRIDGYPKKEYLDKIPIIRLWTLLGRQTPTSYRSRIYPWLFSLAGYLICHRHEYDLIHIHQAMHPAAVCVVVGKLVGKPTVIRITGSGATGNISMLRQWWWTGIPVRHIIRHVDSMVSLSSEITDELLEDGFPESKIVHIPNGVDTVLYSPPTLTGRRTVIKTVLSVGRLSEEKGFDILIKAWAKANKENGAQLIIVGDGIEKEALRVLAKHLGIFSSVVFEGSKNNVIDYLAYADIFVLPSRSEGMSNALLEAMSMGKACIASDIPANKDMIEPGTDGLLFEKNNEDELAAKLSYLFQDPDFSRQLGENARKKVNEKYSIDKIAGKYVELYARLLTSQ